jgi:hypothetical protein
MAKVRFGAIKMPFREQTYDEEGNPKKDKNGNPVIAVVHRNVRHNKAYFPNKK